MKEKLGLSGYYKVVCSGPDGKEKWTEEIFNIVPTAGKNDILDKYYLGSGYTAAVYMGLKGSGSTNATDTQASHAGWLEVGGTNAPAYTGNRKTITMGAAAAGVSTAPSQAFAITSGGTVSGIFVNVGGSATKDNTTGILFSVGNFSGGDRVVAASDTLTVSHSMTIS